jgi:hypothetical protein
MYLFLFCLILLHLSLWAGGSWGQAVSGGTAQSSVSPETFQNLQPERQGQCRMVNSVTVPCALYKIEEKYFLLLYALIENELTLVKIVQIDANGSLNVQKTIWAHEILFI